jgi:hypothetical protein
MSLGSFVLLIVDQLIPDADQMIDAILMMNVSQIRLKKAKTKMQIP